MTKWMLRRNKADIKKMSDELKISSVYACVLANRGIYTRNAADLYINYSVSRMYDCYEIMDMKTAVESVYKYICEKSRIFIYGDYDVDGITSTTILYKILKAAGADVYYYIPDRKKEGYGLNKNALDYIKKQGGDLIFTCDNGIAALEDADYIKKQGMELIILDHHEPAYETENGKRKDILPNAIAVMDTKRLDCSYPFKNLCAGGLSYKFAKAFLEYIDMKYEYEDELFIFAAIATICDIVPLVDENRIIAKHGFELLNSGKITNKGLKALINVRGLEDKKITEYEIGFILGPCINAAGRIKCGSYAVDLFLEDSYDRAVEKARFLSCLNDERKEMTNSSFERTVEKIENSNIKNDKIIVVYDENIDESVAGIVAGKIKEKYYKPSLVIAKGENTAKGSARSIECVNIFEEMYKNVELFEKFGGHAMAAGFSIKNENIEMLREKLNKGCNITQEEMTQIIRIDKELSFSEISMSLAEELEEMRPFGRDNEEAVFAVRNVKIEHINFVGKNKNIMQIIFVDENNIALSGVSFNGFLKFKENIETKFGNSVFIDIINGNVKKYNILVDVVYCIRIDNYNNIKRIKLNIKDFRLIDNI